MKEISVDVPGDKIKLLKNAPQVPTNVKIVFGEYGQPERIIFQYDNKMKNGKEILEWIRQYSYGFCTGYRFTKEQLVFDGEFYFEGRELRGFDVEGQTLRVFNMLLKNADFLDPASEDDIVLTMEMSYDYFSWD
jgi:hypothetical protein